MDIDVILSVCLLEFMVILIPGLDFFMVLKNSITYSNRAGFATAMGVTLGSLINLILSLLGLNSLTSRFPSLITIMSCLGAGYLCYIAYHTFIDKGPIKIGYNQREVSDRHISFKRFFKSGVACNLTNPKAYIFNLSYCQYLLNSNHVFANSFIVLLASSLFSVLWYGTVNIMFGNKQIRSRFFAKMHVLNRVFGAILVIIAINILVSAVRRYI